MVEDCETKAKSIGAGSLPVPEDADAPEAFGAAPGANYGPFRSWRGALAFPQTNLGYDPRLLSSVSAGAKPETM